MAKTLIAYFSWSGKTKALARAVAVKCGADLFEIRTIKEYSRLYVLAVAQAKLEHVKNEHPAIFGKPVGFAAYDKILLGFPIWWFTCPNVILSFLEQNDCTGKVVIPFCTYGSSGKGSCEKDMAAVAPGVNIEPCVEATALKDNAVKVLAELAK